MAKKGQPVQLQIEVTNDDEWEKLLQRDGLIVVDVYSEWCGPCLGMQANLKKTKLEYGGDLLQLAVAKADTITALERFRNKSEPTWMFISKGKMINLMFGADAPKLTRLILEELKKEQAELDGQVTDRTPLDVTEIAEEEKVRYDAVETMERQRREKEERKKAKELLERRTKECENILANLPNYATILIFPSAKHKYKEVLNEILDEAGLIIHQTEKVRLDENAINELCYFAEVSEEFSEESLERLYNDEALMILLKTAPRAEIEDVDDVLLTVIYGPGKKPPGAPESAAEKLMTEEEEEGAEAEGKAKENLVGIWVPPTPQVRATNIRMFFPRISTDYTIPEPPPEPEHLAIIFPLNKKDEVKLNEDILEELLFFTDTKLPLKTIEDFGNNNLSFALLLKRSNENLSGNIDDVVLQMVYGNSREPPGDEKSPAQKLKQVWNEAGKPKDWEEVLETLSEEELEELEDKVLLGIWAPLNSLTKAMALKLLFTTLSGPYSMPDLKEVPLHVAVAYDAFKAKDVFELSDKYPGKVMNFGYFSSDVPGEAKLLGKTTEKFEARTASVTYEEKLVVQLAKDDPQCFIDFVELGPSYMSNDVDAGEADCKYFFPPGYNIPEAEIITYLKKKSKRKVKVNKFKVVYDQLQEGDAQSVIAASEANTLTAEHADEEIGEETTGVDDANETDDEDGEEALKEDVHDDAFESADKATSPVTE